jgi:carbonic anhydrase/acetyltransferase-like protein (isoleucine patch superfamily)
MDAVIFVNEASSAHWDVAGTPLLVRQLEWLFENGCKRVVVEQCASDAHWDEVEHALESHAAAAIVERVLTARPLGPVEVARRAGLGDEKFVAISSSTLASSDLRVIFALEAGTKAMLTPPSGYEELYHADVLVLSKAQSKIESAASVDGWGVVFSCEQEAHELGCAVLDKRVQGVVVHGAEVTPGLWTTRGTVIEDGAILRAPVFVGAAARVCSGAVVGPNAVIGAHSVIEPAAIVREAVVRAETIIGEGVVIERCAASGDEIDDWSTGATANLGDELLLSKRTSVVGSLVPRMLAALVAVLLAPIAALTRAGRALLSELWQVVQGQRCWIGSTTEIADDESARTASDGLVRAAERAPRGVISIDRALWLQGEDRLRMLAWYAREKSLSVDASLLWQRAVGSGV